MNIITSLIPCQHRTPLCSGANPRRAENDSPLLMHSGRRHAAHDPTVVTFASLLRSARSLTPFRRAVQTTQIIDSRSLLGLRARAYSDFGRRYLKNRNRIRRRPFSSENISPKMEGSGPAEEEGGKQSEVRPVHSEPKSACRWRNCTCVPQSKPFHLKTRHACAYAKTSKTSAGVSLPEQQTNCSRAARQRGVPTRRKAPNP